MKMKKFMALLTAVVLILSLCTVASAAEPTYTITVTNAVPGQTYTAYKIFDVTTNGSGGFAYTISATSPWLSTVQNFAATESNGLKVTLASTGVYNVTIDETKFIDTTAAGLAKKLNEQTSKPSPDVSVNAASDATTAVLNVTSIGYYFVDSSLGAVCALISVTGNVNITEKNYVPKIVKAVQEGDNWKSGEANTNDAQIGDTVNFKLTVTAGGAADTSYVVHDTMSAGLTLNTNSFVIKVGESEVDASNYSINTSPTDNHCTFEITFTQAYTSTLTSTTDIVITYSAILNANAVTLTTGNTNDAKLQYGNSYTPITNTITKTYEIDLVKTDVAGKVIDGAKFELYDAATGGNKIGLVKVSPTSGSAYYRPALTSETPVAIEAGNIIIKGLDADTYYLEEIDAPDGYNMLTERVTVTVTTNNKATVSQGTWSAGGIRVENTTGVQLPSTGGMGTTLFTFGGMALILAAGLFLALNRKRVFGK